MNTDQHSDHPALRARDEVRALPPYSFGRDPAALRRETGFTGAVIKLAANEGAEGPLPGALTTLSEAGSLAHRYSEPHSRRLCAVLSEFHGVEATRVIVGNGGCSLISHISSAYLRPGDEVVLGQPTFHLYRLEALRMGAIPVAVPLARNGACDLAAMRAAIGPKTRLLYICSPNNPTGGLVPRAQLEAFLADLPAHVLPIIDEAYFEYVADPEYADPVRISVPASRPVIVLRTFSKIFGLAGLRIGYAIAPPAVVETLRRVQNPYEVNAFAQAVAASSLALLPELSERRQRNLALRGELVAGLRSLGCEPLPSQANFVCLHVGSAKTVAKALEKRGIIVRPLDAMGDASSIRVTVGLREENMAFLEHLAAVLKSAANV